MTPEATTDGSRASGNRRPAVGTWVEVRSPEEIVATLDSQGDNARMPFMPEMLRFAGQRFQVSASAHKTCDTANRTGGRRVRNAVHLADLRCDGSAHGGCQAECLLFWKSAWLKPVDGPGSAAVSPSPALEQLLEGNTGAVQPTGTLRYRCQALQLFAATEPLAWWDIRQYWQDVRSGNAGLSYALSTLFLSWVFNLRRLPVGYRFNVWVYQQVHRLVRGVPDPHLHGTIPKGQPTPDERLDLKVGEVVEIRSKAEIEATVNGANRNRGLNIDEEMTISCGERYRVSTRVDRIINEQTGEMMEFKNPCIVLDGVFCKGQYAGMRLMCPRRITAYWREIWLKRIEPGGTAARPGPG
ncbi:MAG: hypothetical protein ABIX37_10565 [Gammaproteobacteria bacterium]